MMKPAALAIAFGLASLATLSWSQQPPQTLDQARKAVRDGTTPGIVLIPARKRDAAPEAAQPSATAASGAASGAAAPKAAAQPAGGGLLSEIARGLPPPSGQPLNAAKKLDSDKQGIPLPSGKPASAPR